MPPESKPLMPQTSLSKAARFALIALLVPLLLQVSCVPRQPVTIRLAGDEWFLDSLTQTGMHFGESGRVDLRAGLGRDPESQSPRPSGIRSADTGSIHRVCIARWASREPILFLTFLSQGCVGLRERQHFLGRQLGRERQVEKADHHLIETLLPPDDRLRRVRILRILG